MSTQNFSRRQVAFIAATGLAAVALGGVATEAVAAQPNMEEALADLQNARGALMRAAADKGGHRARAVTLIDDAIRQVQMGITFARNH